MLKIKMDKNTKQLLLETAKLFSEHFSFRVGDVEEDGVKEKLNALSNEIERLKHLIGNKNRLENSKEGRLKETIYAKFKKSVKKP